MCFSLRWKLYSCCRNSNREGLKFYLLLCTMHIEGAISVVFKDLSAILFVLGNSLVVLQSNSIILLSTNQHIL